MNLNNLKNTQELKPFSDCTHDRRISRLCNINELSKHFLKVADIAPMPTPIIASDIGNG